MAESTSGRALPGEQALRAWQEGVSNLFRQFMPGAAGTPFGAGATPAAGAAGEGLSRIVESARELTAAQIAVATEWVRLPFTAAGGQTNGLQGLQQSYARLLRAYNGLFQAYVSAAAPVREAAVQAVQQATAQSGAAVRAATDAGAQAAQRAAQTATAVEQRVETAARAASTNGAHAAAAAVDQAEKLVETAERAAASATGTLIKGKINRRGERIYHLPGQANYDRFETDILFDTEAQARAAGYRPSLR